MAATRSPSDRYNEARRSRGTMRGGEHEREREREREREKTGGEGGEKLTEKEGRKERRQGGKRRALLSRERHA